MISIKSYSSLKVLLHSYHRYFFEVKGKTVTDDGIHSDHGYLDTSDNNAGPP